MPDRDNLITPAVNRSAVIGALHEVLERDDSLSRCCAVKALQTMNADDKVSTARLVDLLLDEDPDVRMDAVVALGRMKVVQAALPLLQNLEKDPEGEVRIEVVKALSRISSTQTVERLIHCFREDGYPELDYMVDDLEFNACWEVQSSLMDALAEIGDSRAVEALIEVLEAEGYEDLQESGFRALAKLSGETARKFLLKQLQQGGAIARRRAARALSDLPELHGIASEAGKAAIPSDMLTALTRALADTDPGVRINAAQALAVEGSAVAVVPITQLLSDPDMEVRGEVAAILASIRGRDIVGRLHQLLVEDNLDLRRRIVKVLGEIGEPFSLKPVSFFLDDSNQDLVYEVVVALANIGIAGAEQKLANILADETNHYTLRMQAARALGKQLGNPSGQNASGSKHAADIKLQESTQGPDPREVLEATVYDQSEHVACAALEALAEMDPDNATVQLVRVLDFSLLPVEQNLDAGTAQDIEPDDTDEEIQQGLVDMVAGHDARTSTLAAILANQPPTDISPNEVEDDTDHRQIQPGVRILAVRLLGSFPETISGAVKSLIQATKEGDPELRREAIHSLRRAGDESALDTILDGLSAEQEGVRLAALDALGNFSSSDNVRTRLVDMLEDPDPTIRQRVVEQIISLPGPEVTDYLCRALEDEDLGVCRAALHQLTRQHYSAETARRVESLMFRFSGELRKNTAAVLRRMQDFSSSSRLLENLMDMEQTTNHWVCIDALAEMYSIAGKNNTAGSTAAEVRPGGVG
ncbi:MAG: HEAT repeat domain-containing protein [Gammaproteobacteria bacterium]|nr:HEAT repeat domain-containing protein [Gammaproteobacteria bacterium]